MSRGGINCLLEAKSKGGKLNDEQLDWHTNWRGQVAVVRSTEEAIGAVNEAIRKQGGGA